MTELESLLSAIGVSPGHDDEPLCLDSLQVVDLVDLLEATFVDAGLVLGSDDVTRENFATRRALRECLRARGAPCN